MYSYRQRKFLSINSYLGFIILLPSFFGYLNIGLAQMLFIVICCSYGVLVLVSNKKYSYPRQLRPVAVLFVCQLICYSLTVTSNSINPFSSFTSKDATDLIRPIIYLFYFSIPVLLRYKQTRFINIIYVCMSLSLVLDFIKFIPAFYPIIKLYTHLDPNGLNYARFNGTFTYCYSFGFIVLFLLSYALNASFRYRSVCIISLFIVIFLTGSRSIILGALMLIFLRISFFGESIRKKIGSLIVIGFLILVMYFVLSNLDIPLVKNILRILERGYDSLTGNANDPSFNTRNDQIERAVNNLLRNPLFGVGPQKESQDPIENLFGYYISSWGIAGTGCYIFIWLYFLYNAYRCTSNSNFNIRIFSRANFLWLLMVPFGGMSAPITEGIRLAPLYYLIQGIQGVMLYDNSSLKHNFIKKQID